MTTVHLGPTWGDYNYFVLEHRGIFREFKISPYINFNNIDIDNNGLKEIGFSIIKNIIEINKDIKLLESINSMELTKKYKTDVAKALRCAESGKAYHWPTIATILADEVKRLKTILSTAEGQKEG